MYSNTKNLSKAVLTAAFSLFLVACNSNSGNNSTGTMQVTNADNMVVDMTGGGGGTVITVITVSITGLQDVTTTLPFNVTVTFSEAVMGLTIEEVMDGASGLNIESALPMGGAEPDDIWIVRVKPVPIGTNEGDTTPLSMLISAGVAQNADGTISNVESGAAVTATYTVPDTTPPMYVSHTAPGFHNGSTYTLTITYSEPVMLTAIPLTISNASITSMSVNGSSVAYRINPNGFGTNITLPVGHVVDLVNNANTDTMDITVLAD